MQHSNDHLTPHSNGPQSLHAPHPIHPSHQIHPLNGDPNNANRPVKVPVARDKMNPPPISGDKRLPTSPLSNHNTPNNSNISHNGSVMKSPYTSPPQNHCVSSPMIPERDIGPARLPASPPTITQTTPSTATFVQPNYKPIPQRAVTGPTRLTVQSTPVKSQPPLLSSGLGKAYLHNITHQNHMNNHNGYNNNVSKVNVSANNEENAKEQHLQQLKSPHGPIPYQQSYQSPPGPVTKPKPVMNVTRTHHHGGGGSLDFQGFHKVADCHSSSDENRSSGHASMSDTGHGSSSPGSNKTNGQLGSVPEDRLAAGVTNRNGRSRASTGHSKSRHRATPATGHKVAFTIISLRSNLQQFINF